MGYVTTRRQAHTSFILFLRNLFNLKKEYVFLNLIITELHAIVDCTVQYGSFIMEATVCILSFRFVSFGLLLKT